ncbi:metallophosphoesterase family protein [Paenibacillus turpanensis]|uniref:metallophosphoesterase family protein n=1 Tax=Paenibacillus turpanensis TaxID=2689078 RepID=UPI00140909DA|nr:metallophosphoesterase [Paenibacillus turpanensis]
MNRRHFIRWLAAALFAAAGGTAAWYRSLGGSDRPGSVSPEGAAPTVQQPADNPADSAAKDPNAPLLSFFILSDLHVRYDLEQPGLNLRKTLTDITSEAFQPGLIALTGDLTEFGRVKDYKELRSIFDEFKLPPVHANMGNHDYYPVWIDRSGEWVNGDAMPNGRTDAQSRKLFLDFFGYEKPYNDVWINGSHIILLSQEAYLQEKPEVGEGAWYSDEQLAWLKEKLAEHKNGEPAFIMIHQPLPAQGQDGGSHRLIRAKEFREILKPYKNVFVFSGHQHRDFLDGTAGHYMKETFHWFHNSSVGKVMNRTYRQTRPEAAQGLYVEVFRDHVMLRAREFSTLEWIPQAEWKVSLV